MTPPLHQRRRGAHRSGRSVLAALTPSALAVAAVAALITSLAVWRGEEPVQPSAAASTTTRTFSRAALSQAPPTSSRPVSSPPPSSTSPVTTVAPTPTPSGRAGRDVEVVVLNQTSRAGLAGIVAGVLRGRGWTVPAVGNFRGTVPATTVYYPHGAEDAARAAAQSLPTTARIRPRFGNLSSTRLTVVVTDSYPG